MIIYELIDCIIASSRSGRWKYDVDHVIAMFVIMYFFMIRPQNKKQKEIANFRKSLQVNQSVITAGGIHGTIKEITDDYIVLEIASNVKIKIDKNSIFADASAAGNQSK